MSIHLRAGRAERHTPSRTDGDFLSDKGFYLLVTWKATQAPGIDTAVDELFIPADALLIRVYIDKQS